VFDRYNLIVLYSVVKTYKVTVDRGGVGSVIKRRHGDGCTHGLS